MTIMGINMDVTTYAQVLTQIKIALKDGAHLKVFTPNPEILLATYHDPKYRKVIASADLLLPDGIGVFIAYQIVDFSGPEFVRYLLFPWWCLCAVFFEKKLHAKYGARITGSDLTADVLQVAAATKTPVVIRDIHVETIVTEGDRMKVHNQTATCDLLRAYSPGLDIRLVTSDTDERPKKPYILLCTVGGKEQEIIVDRWMRQDDQILLGMGIGGSIDVITGFREQAPQWLRVLGFEWLFRLIKRPKRHWKRIANVITFLGICLRKG